MVPTPFEPSDARPNLPTIYNTNTTALAFSHRNVDHASSILSKARVVHGDKDQHPVTLPSMVFMSSEAWEKSASFDILAGTVESLVEDHSVAGVISLVSNGISIDTGSVF